MHVRWRKKMLKWFSETGGERFNVSAELVQSVRVDGKVRQKFVACLGSHQEVWINVSRDKYVLDYKPDAVKFWTKVWRKLSTLDLAPDDQARIEAKIAEKIPMPDECLWKPTGVVFWPPTWKRSTRG